MVVRASSGSGSTWPKPEQERWPSEHRGLDIVLHPPARRKIAALLAKVTDAEFAKLQGR